MAGGCGETGLRRGDARVPFILPGGAANHSVGGSSTIAGGAGSSIGI